MAQDALGTISSNPSAVSLDQRYEDNISSTTDVDLFKISASDIPVASNITVTFDGLDVTANNNEFEVSIINANGTLVSDVTGVDTTLSASVTPGNYYVKVRKNPDGALSTETYGISVKVEATTESELLPSPSDNDQLSEANRLIDNVDFTGKLSAGSDTDWYVFTSGDVSGSTVTLNLAASASDATYYSIRVTDENGATLSKAGGTKLETTAGENDGTLSFQITADGVNQPGTYFVEVTANDPASFESSTEYTTGGSYTLTLAGTTDFNAPPVVSVGGVSSGAYGTYSEVTDSRGAVALNSSTNLSDFIVASDPDTDATNATIETYVVGLYDTDLSVAGSISYTKDSDQTTGTITAKSTTGAGFFTELSATEFASATYEAAGSADEQQFWVFVVDSSGSSAASIGLTSPIDTSGIVKYTYVTADAGVTIAGDSTDPITEGQADTAQTLTATISGTPSETVTLVITVPEDLSISGTGVTVVNEETVTVAFTDGTAEFTVSAPVDGDAGTEVTALSFTTASSDALFDGLTIPDVEFTVKENVATFSVSDVTYASGSAVKEGSTTQTASYTLTAGNLAEGEVLTLNLGATGVTITSDTVVELSASAPSTTITLIASDDEVVEGAHFGFVTHAIYEGDTPSQKYLGAIDNQSIAIADNDFAGGTVTGSVTVWSNSQSLSAPATLTASGANVTSTSVDNSSGTVVLTDFVGETISLTGTIADGVADNVDLLDVLALLDHISGTSTLTGGGLAAANANGDAEVDLIDALEILDIISSSTDATVVVTDDNFQSTFEVTTGAMDLQAYVVGDVLGDFSPDIL